MMWDEFVEKVNSGEIEFEEAKKGLLHVFGNDYYKEYIELIQMQILDGTGYRLDIVKEI